MKTELKIVNGVPMVLEIRLNNSISAVWEYNKQVKLTYTGTEKLKMYHTVLL